MYVYVRTLVLLSTISLTSSSAQLTWSPAAVTLETERASWTRMVQLQDSSWLAAYMVGPRPSTLRIKRSFDKMRSWQFIGEVREAGRNLDNANMYRQADGIILLAIRSVVDGKSYRIQIYRSVDDGNSFAFLSTVDASENTGGSTTRGVYEPFLAGLPNGTIACFYANEKHSTEKPSFSQVISERISADGGGTWGPEILAVAQQGAARPGEPNVIFLNSGGLALFYEVCGAENCVGHTSYSADGITWTGDIGPPISGTWQNAQAVAAGPIIVATSNARSILVSSGDLASWRDTGTQPPGHGSWPGLYQTAPNEIALVIGAAGNSGAPGQYIWFGQMHAPVSMVWPRQQ